MRLLGRLWFPWSLPHSVFSGLPLISTEGWGGSICSSLLESGFVFLLPGDLKFELSLFQTILKVGSVRFSLFLLQLVWMAGGAGGVP